MDAASVAGTLPAITSACYDMGATLTLTGKVGNVTKWLTSGDNGATWSNYNTTATVLNFSNVTKAVSYKAIVKNKTCKADTSATAKVGVRNLWTGEMSRNWNKIENWSDETLPSPAYCDDIIIPVVSSKRYPTLKSAITSIKNLKVLSGASLTLGDHTLQISGSIDNSGIIDATNGTIELNGTSGVQSIAGSMFDKNTLKNLILSNNVTVSNALNDTLNILGTLSFGNANAKLITGDNITLKSTAAGTAAVGIAGAGNSITGKVIVERYLNMGTNPGQHGKSWQFLATPTNGQTIWQSWMENGNKTSTGYGTQISGSGAGFDLYSALPALKYYDYSRDSWIGITNTTNPVFYQNGYMLFVRGDRSVAFPQMNNTTLRTKGTLVVGTTPPITVHAGKFESIGNPYASSIDFTKINKGSGIENKFYAWDPYIAGYYNVGGYQTMSSVNNWNPVPGGSPLYPTNVPCSTIRSGSAFFVHATGGSGFLPADYSVSFSENAKIPQDDLAISAKKGSGNLASLARPQSPASRMGKRQFFSVSLFTGPNNDDIIADGNVVAFDADFSNDIDGDDALKITPGGESFSIQRSGKILAIEARSPLVSTDTIYYNMSHLAQKNYQLRFAPQNIGSGGVEAYLADQFLNTNTPLSLTDSSFVNITVSSNSASSVADRFKVIFRPMAPLPVAFTSIKATQKNQDILIEWKVENEKNIRQYEVEKSMDGSNFSKVALVAANNGSNTNYSYSWLDQNTSTGYNYYRVHSVDVNGQSSFTSIVKVLMGKMASEITVYPNPVINGIINLKFINQPKGIYGIRLLNPLGQVIISRQISNPGESGNEILKLNNDPARGIYQLEVTAADGHVKIIKVIY